MSPAARKIAPLLFGSGFCALVYQIAWTREFRLIFGASTEASAAVLAIFIGGLGVGGVWLGKRADREREPLVFYARLEALVALTTMLTPALFWLVRRVYIGLGGTVTLGLVGGTLLRLLLATLVLSVPTIAMGGTLPAAARAAEGATDEGRRGVALLYGINTLGAVTGCLLSNFLLLEVFGSRVTLWMACLCNLLVALVAVRVSRDLDEPAEAAGPRAPAPESDPDAAPDTEPDLPPDTAPDGRSDGPGAPEPQWQATAPASFVLAGAAVVGFAFFLMELVWYRMLGPILGGTVFTFGLILAVALLGIGVGGACYAVFGQQRTPTLIGFATTCLLEALLIALPFALGDHLALLSLMLQQVGKLGFWGHVFGWFVVTSVVALPAAFVSGVQFPMLIALLGRGRQDVGKQIGLTYGWNTVGSAVGSLAGGFGLLPLLGATGCWRLVSLLLAGLGAAALALSLKREKRLVAAVVPVVVLAGTLGLQVATGPTAVWRHGGIGAGRFPGDLQSANGLQNAINSMRQNTIWETDGVESSVALRGMDGLSFIVNGKSDGNAISDAGTQVMAGIVGSLLRPDAKSAAVIGLGTGSTAGWLAAVPTVQRVDVFEIESAIGYVARACGPVNQNALDNPKVKMRIADAREVLQVTPQRYDIIFSEPSNPYRAGIASLFTQDFYLAARERLNNDGIFMQWVQGYEISPRTIRTIYGTLGSVFPVVETWVLDSSDLLLVASREPHLLDVARTRALLKQEPYHEAMASAWHSTGLEGLLAHYIASPALGSAVARLESQHINTDDLNPVEFGFARSVGDHNQDVVTELNELARARRENRPGLTNGDVNWDLVEEERACRRYISGQVFPVPPSSLPEPSRSRWMAMRYQSQGDPRQALKAWKSQEQPVQALTEISLQADTLATLGNADEALPLIEQLATSAPLEAGVLRAWLLFQQNKMAEATSTLETVFVQHRQNPWLWGQMVSRAINLSLTIGKQDHALGRRLIDAMSQPFAVRDHDSDRRRALFELAFVQPDPQACATALAGLEPHPPWEEQFLQQRLACYNEAHHALAGRAAEDYQRFLEARGSRFDEGLRPSKVSP